MAPRLIPTHPEFRSGAEETVWKRLKSQLPADAFLAANMRLHSHDDVFEADLIVGYPGAGFAVIEVKGGRVEHTDDGWMQATPDGPKLIDPAGQADGAKRRLNTFARRRGWSHGPIRFESLVAFPDVSFDELDPSPDVPRWSLIAAGDLDTAGEVVFAALNRRMSDVARPTARDVEEMADLLGGRPAPASMLAGVAAAREAHITALTEQQYDILTRLRTMPRLQVSGGPGSGKTWLALEQARRWADSGEQVLFLCYSRGLARWVTRAVDNLPTVVARRITVSTFHAYGVSLGVQIPATADGQWWESEAPALMAELARPTFDALVVDEAQDFADAWWPPLLTSLRGQHLLVAGDDRQAVFANRAGRPDVALTEITLDTKLRNTVPIAKVFNSLGTQRMSLSGGDGPPVRFEPCATEDAIDRADAEIDRLLDAGHEPGSLALLTTCHRHPLHRSAEDRLGKEGYWDAYWMADEVFYGTVMGFKGLEKPVVVLAVDGFHGDVGREVMYAGLSRPRDELVVCGDLDVIRAAVGDEVARRIAGTR